jgi:hypothetical protein
MRPRANDSDEFDQALDEVLKEWPAIVDVSDGTVSSIDSGKFPELERIHYHIEDRLVDSGRPELTEVNWALFTVLHRQAMTTKNIALHDLRRELVRAYFERNRAESAS